MAATIKTNVNNKLSYLTRHHWRDDSAQCELSLMARTHLDETTQAEHFWTKPALCNGQKGVETNKAIGMNMCVPSTTWQRQKILYRLIILDGQRKKKGEREWGTSEKPLPWCTLVTKAESVLECLLPASNYIDPPPLLSLTNTTPTCTQLSFCSFSPGFWLSS